MKRLMCVILAAAMLVSFGTAASASTDSEAMERVLASVKERIGSTDEYDTFHSSENTYNKKTFYDFEWNRSEGESKSLYITASASGIITSYSYFDENTYNYDGGKGVMNRKNADEVLKKAQEYVNALNPSISSSLKVSRTDGFESLYSRNYRFDIERVENGVSVSGDGGSITIASDGETLSEFNISFTEEAPFKGTDGAINKEDARAAFEKNIGLKLRYETTYDGERQIRLIYSPDCKSNEFIDAFTGEKTEIKESFRYYDYGGGANKEEAAADSTAFTAAESAQIEEVAGLIGAEAAENLVYSNKTLNVRGDLKLSSIRRNRSYSDDEKVFYQMRFSSESKSDTEIRENIWVTMDAKTGEITYFTRTNTKDSEKKISDEKAKSIAQSAVSALAGGKLSEYKANEESDSGYYSYTRYVNDIPVSFDNISVGVNLYDGSISYYSINYTADKFPSPDGIITPGAAADALFAKVGYSLSYMPDYDETSALTEFKLLYKFDDTSDCRIDAVSGKVDVYEGREAISYNDIGTHYAKDAIETLAKYGIGFEGESFLPDSAITQKEYLAFVFEVVSNADNIIIGEDTDYDYIYRAAKRSGIIKDGEIDRNSPVTRQMAAVFMVRALGYGPVADLDIYKTSFNDVSEYAGHISILTGMKILNGDGSGSFNPSGLLTRGDAAIVLKNTLAR